jgi:type IV pilus assembly protein PilN
MIRINLQSAGQKKQKRKTVVADTGGGAGGGPSAIVPFLMLMLPFAGGLGGAFFVHTALVDQVQATQAAIGSAEAELARLKPILDELEQFKKDRDLLEQKLAAIRTLEATRTGPVKNYAELAALMPPQVWIASLRESGGNVVIDGFGLDSQSVAVFVNAVQRSTRFSSAELTAVDASQYLGLNIKRFNVVARLRSADQAATGRSAPTAPSRRAATISALSCRRPIGYAPSAAATR